MGDGVVPSGSVLLHLKRAGELYAEPYVRLEVPPSGFNPEVRLPPPQRLIKLTIVRYPTFPGRQSRYVTLQYLLTIWPAKGQASYTLSPQYKASSTTPFSYHAKDWPKWCYSIDSINNNLIPETNFPASTVSEVPKQRKICIQSETTKSEVSKQCSVESITTWCPLLSHHVDWLS